MLVKNFPKESAYHVTFVENFKTIILSDAALRLRLIKSAFRIETFSCSLRALSVRRYR